MLIDRARFILLSFVFMLLAACGGSGGDDDDNPPPLCNLLCSLPQKLPEADKGLRAPPRGEAKVFPLGVSK